MIDLIIFIVSLVACLIVGICIGFYIVAKSLHKTIDYKNDLIEKLTIHMQDMKDTVRKYEYNNNVKVFK